MTHTAYYYEDLTPGIEIHVAVDSVPLDSIERYQNLVVGDRVRESSDSRIPSSYLVSLLVEKHLRSIFIDSFVEGSSHHFRFLAPVIANEPLTATFQVTNRKLSGDATRGSVGIRVRLNSLVAGEVLEGTLSVVVLTRSSDAASTMEESRPSFASPGWLAKLLDLLSANEMFAEATSPFDGSIAIDFGAGAIGLRLYRGRIIDNGRSIVNGATFTVGAPPWTWLELASNSRNDFIEFAMHDAFYVKGSTYEYLRMTKALIVLTDQVRALLNEV